ncbi:hypothetical protein Tco_0286342 [Tanacetum coccineum]
MMVFNILLLMNGVSSSGTKKNYEVSKKATSSNNPFDALTTIEEGDELGSNGGSSNSGKKVVQDVASSASSNPSNTPLVARINELESKKIEGKLIEVEEKENHGEDPYDDDDFDDLGLTDAQMKFANAFDVNLRGRLR